MSKRSGGSGLRFRAWVLIAFSVVMLGLGSASFSSTSLQLLRIEPIDYVTDLGEVIPAERGFFNVPEDWTAADGTQIELSFVRLQSTSPAPSDPLVYLVGGPGNSAFFVGQSNIIEVLKALRAISDVILVEQRGTSQSAPFLKCPTEWTYPEAHPVNESTLIAQFEIWSSTCAVFWIEQGINLNAYHTLSSARDLDHLRTLIEAERLNLMGFSYGTHLGLAFMKHFPDRVGRSVLGGVEGLHQSLKLPSNVDQILESLNEQFDFIGPLSEILQSLEEEPLTVEVSHPATGVPTAVPISTFSIQWLMASLLGDRQNLQLFSQVLALMEQGRYEVPAMAFLDLFNPNTILAMTFTTDCASGVSDARLAEIETQAQSSLLGNAINFPFRDVCQFWPYEDLGEDFRESFVSPIPTLFISGSLDARTPPANVDEMIANFPNGHHMIVQNGGHGNELFVGDQLVIEQIVSFFAGQTPTLDEITLPPIQF